MFRPDQRVVVRGRLATVSTMLANGAVIVRYDGDDQKRVVPADRIQAVDDSGS